jgi:hypothetical protein
MQSFAEFSIILPLFKGLHVKFLHVSYRAHILCIGLCANTELVDSFIEVIFHRFETRELALQ